MIICALSGGADSAVMALILKQKHNIRGVFLKMHNFSDEGRAKEIAKKLEIPLDIIDVREEFQGRVISPFLEAYQANKTPNPCVVCNKELKFYFLLKQLEKFPGLVATGHYARIRKKDDKYYLLRAKIKAKDQSYFLYRLTQKDLSKIIFPLAEFSKKEILNIAQKNNLIDSFYQESQEICFVNDNVKNYLAKNLGQMSGKIIDINGNILGNHLGLHFYTLGQRRGIGFSGGPYYVIKKDKNNNFLVVSKNKNHLIQRSFKITDVNWINKINFPIKAKVKIRSKSEIQSAIINKLEKSYFIELKNEEIGITAGQSAVFYKEDEVLGGGIIK